MYDLKEIEQIWITGSNSSLLSREYANLLTGRNLKISIYPLSFSEYLSFKDMPKFNMPVTRQHQSQIIYHFQNYLIFGAFPAIALRDVYQRELLTSYFEDLLYKDIASRHEVNTIKLKDLAIYLATHSAKLFSYRNIAEALGLHINTVQDYLSYMKEIFLFDEIYKFDYSLKNQYSHDKKIYISDTGLAHAISFRFSQDKDRILETIIYQALKRKGHDIYFHRGKKECDFIVKDGITIVQAIQVTCSLSDIHTKKREIDGLIDAMKTYRLDQGLILTLDESDAYQLIAEDDYHISVQPAWKWLLQ